jgi:hypothetical protein
MATEEFKVNGEDIMATIKRIIAAGNARKIIIKNESGDTVVEFPLTIGAVGVVIAPVLAAIGAIAALVTKCTIVVEKRDDSKPAAEPESTDQPAAAE